MLIRVARVIHDRSRTVDLVARLGGDEFAVLLPETDERGGGAAGQALLDTLRLELDRMRYPVTASIGVATYLSPPPNFAEALVRSDELMYVAKQSTKNAVVQRTFGSESPRED